MRKLFFILSFIFFLSGFAQNELSPGIGFGVDRLPEVVGGKQEFKRFLSNHLVYPVSDLKSKKNGFVQIDFVCSKDGKIISYFAHGNFTEEMREEAIRLFKLLEFRPALKGNEAVAYEASLTFPFSIKEFHKSEKRKFFIKSNLPQLQTDTSSTVFVKVDKPARFIEGLDSLTRFLLAQLEYPTMAKQQNIEGTVRLAFIVEIDGRISNVDVISPVSGGCNEEAIRVLSLTRWIPAVVNGKYVRSRMSFPVSFTFRNNFKDHTMGSQYPGGQ